MAPELVLSVVVAVFNEDPRNLDRLLDRLDASVGHSGITYEVIFVDDGSVPETARALKQLVKSHDHVKLLVLSRNFGQQAAISAGLDHCSGAAAVNIDSDCQDPPEFIPKMIEEWRRGYDVVYAQRSTRRDRFSKRISAHLFYRLLGAVSPVRIPRDTGDFRLLDRRVINVLRAMPEKTRFLRGLIPWIGFRQAGITIDRDARELGKSTYTLRKLFALAADGLLSLSSVPLYMVLWLGLLLTAGAIACILGATVIATPSVSMKLTNESLLFFVSLLSGVQLICLGGVAVYVAKVLDEARGRPTYIVAERIGFEKNEGAVVVKPGRAGSVDN